MLHVLPHLFSRTFDHLVLKIKTKQLSLIFVNFQSPENFAAKKMCRQLSILFALILSSKKKFLNFFELITEKKQRSQHFFITP